MAENRIAYVFDTFGTTIPLNLVEGLNAAFFQYAVSHLGLEEKCVNEFKAMREKNPKDPYFLRESGPAKVRLLESGLYVVSIYDDVKPTFERIYEEGANTVIFSKGATGVVAAAYKQVGVERLVREVISTSENFPINDKTNPACYEALQQRLKEEEQTMRCYVSDDSAEVNACQEALPCDVFYIDRGQKRTIPIAKKVRIIKGLQEIF